MKIVSWNINGIRSQKSNISNILEDLNAEVLCLQETKITRDLLEESLAVVEGYHSFFSFSKKRSGYSGVATYCKKDVTPAYAQDGLAGSLGIGFLSRDAGGMDCLTGPWDNNILKDLDSEGRCLITQHRYQDENGVEKLLSLINVYCPRADPDRPERAEYKLAFYELLKQRAWALKSSGSSVVILGDINTSHRRIDHCDPDDDQEFEKRPGRVFLDTFLMDISTDKTSFSEETNSEGNRTENENESAELSEANDFQVVDTFRYFHPCKEGAFTCWNTQVGARSTNYGTRIDYILCNHSFLPYVQDSEICQEFTGSDHCPISISTQRIKFLASDLVPLNCTKFYPEFHGSQQKISSYFLTGMQNNSATSVQVTGNNKANGSKRKLSKSEKMTIDPKRKTGRPISSFFLKSSNKEKENNETEKLCGDSSDDNISLVDQNVSQSNLVIADTSPFSFCDSKETESKSKVTTTGWNFLMKSLPPAPLCPGHNEVAVLRTVKKKGENFNKQFYCCARGLGKDGDPNARCNFFKWFSR